MKEAIMVLLAGIVTVAEFLGLSLIAMSSKDWLLWMTFIMIYMCATTMVKTYLLIWYFGKDDQ